MVEFCPDASSATANTVPAAPAPTSGASSRCASAISATSVWPARWKAAAASTRIAALMKKARNSATLLSSVASPIACALASSSGAIARVCTSDEWR